MPAHAAPSTKRGAPPRRVEEAHVSAVIGKSFRRRGGALLTAALVWGAAECERESGAG